MEIERINENTIKFYISYVDIENRGFKREEIWYNRERSEQLFWQMMEELNYKEEFTVEGPLWIQVQALEKGLEVIVTKAQISKNGENLDLFSNEDLEDITDEEALEQMLEQTLPESVSEDDDEEEEEHDKSYAVNVVFNEFEDVIQMSHAIHGASFGMNQKLIHYKDKYFLHVEFSPEHLTVEEQEAVMSLMYEFATQSQITLSILEEYGKVIFEEDVFKQVSSYFEA